MEGHSRGFTIIELMVTLAMAAIIVTLALPNLRGMVQNNRSASAGNAFVTALNLARTAAVQRSIPVSICPKATSGTACSTGSDWSTGWLVFEDSGATGSLPSGTAPIQSFSALSNGATLTVTPSASYLTYDPTGALITSTGTIVNSDYTFSLQLPDCTGQANRTITINPQGRVTSAAASC